ncbi:MAG: Hpt domain-containing protein [Spirochaetaceae bacterium]|jgi:HPt (histidine-containing phosphotransfer) domain-containing protein|nr:Hpt domain-containing protein [Spirochaetaceae bacterium]
METITVPEKPEFTGIFSKEHLLNTFMNDAESAKLLLAHFLERTTKQLEDMTDYINNQNWEEMYRIAHMIRGSVTTLSGMDLGQAAGRIEKAYKQNDTAGMAAAFPFAVEAFQRFKAAAEEYIHN